MSSRRSSTAILLACVLGSGAQAADLPSRAAPPLAAPLLPAFTWTGFYVGVNAGAGFGLNRGGYNYRF